MFVNLVLINDTTIDILSQNLVIVLKHQPKSINYIIIPDNKDAINSSDIVVI
jgi:hypothetical protein